MSITYLDLDILIELAGDKFRARVLNSPSGQARIEFTLAVSENDLLVLYRDGARDSNAARKLGAELFDTLFAGDLKTVLRSSLDVAAHTQQGLRVRLRLNDAPVLAALPWEFLYDASTDRFLAHSNGSPIVRFLELPERIEPFAFKPPLRMLVIFSGPTDYPPLDAEKESGRLGEALRELERQGLLVREVLQDATLTRLQQRLRTNDYHILHYVGHGGFLSDTQEGALVFQDEIQHGRMVSGRDLGTLLRDSKSLRLVVLNACESARSSKQNPFTGVAPELVQQGVPAVIAMQFPISDQAAIAFATGFYTSLADGLPVDASVSEARKTILAQVNNAEWATPVLFLRSADGRIFDLAQLTESERKHLSALGLGNAGQESFASEDWANAIKYWQASQSLELSADITNKLQQATRQQQLAKQYAEARSVYEAGRWRDAVDRLNALRQLALGYKDVEMLLENARKNLPPDQAGSAVNAPPGSPKAGPLEAHYQSLSNAILNGRLVAFLGAGANLCGRPDKSDWQSARLTPSSSELAEYLSTRFSYSAEDKTDLSRVSQFIDLTNGRGPLYDELHRVLDVDYPFTPLHEFFATLPGLLRAKGLPLHYMLIVTANFDDVLERSFQAANEPFDLVTYIAAGEEAGKFSHQPPGGNPIIIDKPNEYRGLSLDQRTVILKLHGAVSRGNPDQDSYAITEDDYIEYLARTDISNLIPVNLTAKLRRSNFLFLGYSLRDWNLRVILHRIWGEQKLSYKSWSVLVDPQPLDEAFWRQRDVDLIQVVLEDYIQDLGVRMQSLTPAASKP